MQKKFILLAFGQQQQQQEEEEATLEQPLTSTSMLKQNKFDEN